MSNRGFVLLWAFLTVVGYFAGVFDRDTRRETAEETPPEPAPVSVVVPDLTGTRVATAVAKLRQLGVRDDEVDGLPEAWDLSPAGRSVLDSNGPWIVVATAPDAGETWAPGVPMEVYALRAEELQWFDQHPRMPDVPAGVAATELVSDGQLFGPVAGLIEWRLASDYATEYGFIEPVGRPVVQIGPVLQPQKDLDRLGALEWASEYGTETVGQVPDAGTPLQVGQLLGVTVRDPQRAPSSGGSNGSGYGYGDGDDGDFNVPGWACPTRWC